MLLQGKVRFFMIKRVDITPAHSRLTSFIRRATRSLTLKEKTSEIAKKRFHNQHETRAASPTRKYTHRRKP